MKWIMREKGMVDRVACPWRIKRFVDRHAEFLFVPADRVTSEAERTDVIHLDVPRVELGHHGQECSLGAIVKKYGPGAAPAMALMARIVNGADTDNVLSRQPEGPELAAVVEGFRRLGFADDHAVNAAEWTVNDGLDEYCREMIRQGRPHGAAVP